MATWFTGDLHVGHTNMLIYEARPPWIDRQMVYNWNKVVKEDDVVWVLGDFIWRRHDYWLPQFNGTIHLVRGNHDSLRRYGDHVIVHRRPVRIGFKKLGSTILSHHPQDTKLLNLCGHVHGWWKHKFNYVNVGVDVWGYKPIREEQIVQLMEEE